LRVRSSEARGQIQAALTLDDAIQALSRPSANTRRILERVSDKLLSQGDGTLQRDIRNFLARLPRELDEFPCAADFLRSRASRELDRLKERLLGSTPQPLEPAVCYSKPSVLEAKVVARANGVLELYGFDFDQSAPELVLIHNGSFEDVSTALTLRNQFHLTVKTGRDGVPFSRDSEALGVAWGHILHYTIPIVQEATALCKPRVENIPAGTVVRFSPPRFGEGIARIQGTRKIWGKVELETVANALEVRLCATITAGRGQSVFSGCGSEQIFSSGSDQRIDRILGSTESVMSNLTGKRSGPVAAWMLAGTDSMPEVSVTLKELRIESMPAEGCLSPSKYNEAKQRNQLSRDTVRRLDASVPR
jgi:hypothetical protein